MSLSDSEQTRYARHLALGEIGAAGQERLKAARVLVVGAGGLGSPAALYLAAAGCGTLGLVDCDRVELSNLQRQILFDTHSLGRAKAAAGRERLAALNPQIRVVAHELEVRAANVCALVAEYDLVLDGSDRLATRYVVNDACVLLGATAGIGGDTPLRRPALRATFPGVDRATAVSSRTPLDGVVANCATAGVLGVLPGVLGTLQATEALKSLPQSASRCSAACSPMTRSRCASASFVSGAGATVPCAATHPPSLHRRIQSL